MEPRLLCIEESTRTRRLWGYVAGGRVRSAFRRHTALATPESPRATIPPALTRIRKPMRGSVGAAPVVHRPATGPPSPGVKQTTNGSGPIVGDGNAQAITPAKTSMANPAASHTLVGITANPRKNIDSQIPIHHDRLGHGEVAAAEDIHQVRDVARA